MSCASRRWRVNLADIKTAFLNSDERDPDAEPTYLEPPSEGLPGVPAGALLLVLKDFYEFNDAPEKWRKRLDRELRAIGEQALDLLGRHVALDGVTVDEAGVAGGQLRRDARIELDRHEVAHVTCLDLEACRASMQSWLAAKT